MGGGGGRGWVGVRGEGVGGEVILLLKDKTQNLFTPTVADIILCQGIEPYKKKNLKFSIPLMVTNYVIKKNLH